MPSLKRLLGQTNRLVNHRLVPRVLVGRCPMGLIKTAAMRHVAVYPGLGIAYNRIKKNANSTTVMLLRELESGRIEPEPLAKRRSWHLAKMPFVFATAVPQLTFMVIVRNPYSRVLSAFLNKFSKPAYMERYRPYSLSAGGFAEFIAWLEDGNLDKDAHWDLQSKLLLMPLDRYDRVIRFERYHEELTSFLASLGIDAASHPRATTLRAAESRSSRGDTHRHDFYDPTVAARVAALYAADFRALGYDETFPR